MGESRLFELFSRALLAGAQVVSDFGFFGRKKAEDFLASFEDTYYLRQLRISGDSVRCAVLIMR